MTSRWTTADIPSQAGRTVVVTGANSGLGLVTARELARAGASVTLAVRDQARGEAAAASIDGAVTVRRLDLADLESVRAFADGWIGPLDVLVNNAGIMMVPAGITIDGFELQFGTNHLGHFALTGLLMPHLLAAPAPRVTTVSSIAHHPGDGAVLEGNPATGYDTQVAYGRSKLANLLFATELQRRATASGSALTSTAAHPGISGTNLIASRDGMGATPVIGTLTQWVVRAIFPNPDQGAEAILYAATDAAPGSYSGPTGFRETRGPVGEAKLSPWAQDETLAGLLWERSEELTGVSVTP
jgi:NAD(P)-dependent dehydrogenase (short-subunit alcohol dehydrogenase family)